MKRLLLFALLAALSAIAAEPKGGADPAATKLLFDARAARAQWENFPGFFADVAVNFDGKVTKGKVEVKPNGDVKLDLPQGAAESWAHGQLKSIVGHRLSDGSDLDTPCVFADEVTDHPLGRAIKVLNDEFHSSYRIKDRQVIEVNRRTKDTKFTITVLENQLNEEKKYLPSTYIVTTWWDLDAGKGAQTKTTAYHQEWKRVGKFDLPSGLTVVAPGDNKLDARSITLTNFKLR